MRGVKIKIFKKMFQMKLFPVLHCRHVVVHRNINFILLATTVYSGGVPEVCVIFLKVYNICDAYFKLPKIKLGKW